MPTFPTTEAEVIKLANEMKAGFASHAIVYPEPPVAPAGLTTALTAVQNALDALTAARANAEAATVAKTAALEALVAAMKKDLRYAENTVDGEDAALKLIGWGGRKEPAPLAVPGQARTLVVYPQGEGWLDLEWQAPADGGKVANYIVQRRPRTETAWTIVGTTFERAITLQNQPRGVEFEYCVVATNKTGNGPMSNVVTVVL